MANAKEPCFAFCVIPIFISQYPNSAFLEITTNFELVEVNISSRHSNSSFAHHFVIHWLVQNGANKNQHKDSYQRETMYDKFILFVKLVRQNKTKQKKVWAKDVNLFYYVSKLHDEGILCLPWWLKYVKWRSKIALFFF